MESVAKILFLWGLVLVLYALVLVPRPLQAASDVNEGFVAELAPAPATLKDPREPFHLLKGVLPDAPKDNQLNFELNSSYCTASDIAFKHTLTGNYVQETNNFKHRSPESCSAPFHELVNNFYTVN
jgi:hypothetical protein